MDDFTKRLIARIDLLNRVMKEHDPIVLRSYPVGDEYEGDRKVATKHAFEENQRLLRTADTCEAARLELKEIYRILQVTDDVPSYVAIEVVAVRLQDQGAMNWANKVHRLGVPDIHWAWLKDQHIEDVRRTGCEIDASVREALMLEDGYEQSLAYAEQQANAAAATDEAA